MKVGDTLTTTIINLNATNAITLAAGTGVTVTGSATVAVSSSATFLIRASNVTSGSEAVVIYRIWSNIKN